MSVSPAHQLTPEEGGKPPPASHGQLSFTRWYTPSFWTFWRTDKTKRHSLQKKERLIPKKAQNVQNCPNNQRLSEQASHTNETKLGLTNSLPSEPTLNTSACHFKFSHHTPLLCCHSPSTVRERLSFAVTAGPVAAVTQLPGFHGISWNCARKMSLKYFSLPEKIEFESCKQLGEEKRSDSDRSKKNGGIFRPKRIFSKHFEPIHSGGFGGSSNIFFRKKCFHLFSSRSLFILPFIFLSSFSCCLFFSLSSDLSS